MNKLWSIDEMNLLVSGLSDEEISEKTGRTIRAIRLKRYKMTGHCVSEKLDETRTYSAVTDPLETRIERIKALAKRLGVKLLGKD